MAKTATKKGFLSDLTVTGSYGKGWEMMKASLWPLLVVILIVAILDSISGIWEDKRFSIMLLSLAWSIFLTGPLYMGAAWVFLKAARKEKHKIVDMFDVFSRNYWNAVIAGLLTSIVVVIGLILLIIPGIILLIRLVFVPYLIMDRKQEALEAMKTSWAMTKGHSWTIFGMFLLAIPILIVGVLALIVGVLFSIVWIGSAFAVLYHSVSVKR